MVAVPHQPVLANMFLDAKHIDIDGDGRDWLVVPHNPASTFILRQMGIDCPSPICHYKFTGHMAPFKVQIDTVSHLIMNQKAYVLNEMGTGKTKAALWAWDYLYSLGMTGKLIVFAPLSTLYVVWGAEVLETTPHRKAVVVHGDRKKRFTIFNDRTADIYIVNHDGHKVIMDELAKRPEISHVIIDELAIYMANYCNSRPWTWGMTGSPVPTAPTDVFAQAKIVTPNTVPTYFKYFRDEVMFKVNEFKWVPKQNAVDKAFAALQPAVRFTLDDVTELPPVIERFINVPMGKKQADIYKTLHDDAFALFQQHIVTAKNAGGIMNKLMQVACGWVYSTKGEVATLDGAPRIQAMIDAIESTGNKILVFATFKHATEGIAAALRHAGYSDFTVITGDTPAGQRAKVFTEFQKTDKWRILVAHPNCLAHGVTLTRADTICWFNPTMNLEILDQANQRIRRVGQKHKQQILYFQGAPVEHHIYRLLRNKQNLQLSLLDLFKEQSSNL
jgi:SNF2 family DNA or RNA helicase